MQKLHITYLLIISSNLRDFVLLWLLTVSLVLVICSEFSRHERKLREFTEVNLTLVITIVSISCVVYIYSITDSKFT